MTGRLAKRDLYNYINLLQSNFTRGFVSEGVCDFNCPMNLTLASFLLQDSEGVALGSVLAERKAGNLALDHRATALIYMKKPFFFLAEKFLSLGTW